MQISDLLKLVQTYISFFAKLCFWVLISNYVTFLTQFLNSVDAWGFVLWIEVRRWAYYTVIKSLNLSDDRISNLSNQDLAGVLDCVILSKANFIYSELFLSCKNLSPQIIPLFVGWLGVSTSCLQSIWILQLPEPPLLNCCYLHEWIGPHLSFEW